ncbi:hypothetical protein B0H34DRAFT_824718 [Crassisporium funariophilum]|nr:hypothetical protein B0H34DRAFT_824718 [Crassisporium funariophilum]
MTKVHNEQATWKKVDLWLDKHTDNSAQRGGIEECRSHLKTIGWHSTLDTAAGKVKVLTLAPMLADSMISGMVLDLMIASLSLKLESNKTSCQDHYLVPLIFMDMLTKAWKDRNTSLSCQNKVLSNIESQIKISRRRSLLFPAHLKNKQHFIGFKIDFVVKKISYGDSLFHKTGILPSIERITKMLQWWLQSRWGLSFSFMGCELEHGHQQDGTSCGFTNVNMLAYESLGSKPLWYVSQRTSYRIQWFNILMKEQKEEKNEPPASSVDNSAELRRPTSLGQPHSPMLIEMPPTADMSSSKRILGGFGAAAMEDNEDIFKDYKLAKNTPAYDMLVDEHSSGAASSPPPSLPASSRPTTRCSSLARDDKIASNEDKDYNVAIMIEDD